MFIIDESAFYRTLRNADTKCSFMFALLEEHSLLREKMKFKVNSI